MDKIINWLVLKWIELTSSSKFPTRDTLVKPTSQQSSLEADREKLERIINNDIYRN